MPGVKGRPLDSLKAAFEYSGAKLVSRDTLGATWVHGWNVKLRSRSPAALRPWGASDRRRMTGATWRRKIFF